MFVRRRPLLRAAVVGGGAYMAGKSVARQRADREYMEADQDQRLSALEQQQQAPGGYAPAAPPPAPAGYAPAAPPPAGNDTAEPSMLDQLNQIADLHKQGILTDSEFAAAKAKLLST